MKRPTGGIEPAWLSGFRHSLRVALGSGAPLHCLHIQHSDRVEHRHEQERHERRNRYRGRLSRSSQLVREGLQSDLLGCDLGVAMEEVDLRS